MTKEEAGVLEVRAMIRDDIRTALRAGNRAHAGALLLALRHFLAAHPVKRTAPVARSP